MTEETMNLLAFWLFLAPIGFGIWAGIIMLLVIAYREIKS